MISSELENHSKNWYLNWKIQWLFYPKKCHVNVIVSKMTDDKPGTHLILEVSQTD